MANHWIIILELVLYLGGMLWIGAYFGRKKLTQAEYHLGGRRMKGWVLALSERATGESAWLILGLTGAAYGTGLSELWVIFGCVGGIVVSWIFLARKFREESEKYGVITFIDYFAVKFKSHADFIRWFMSLIIVLFYVIYVYAQFSGGGKILYVTFGIVPFWGVLISALITILYSTAGGFMAVVWTDAVQAILMMVTFLVTPIVALITVIRKGLSISAAIQGAGHGFDSLTRGRTGLGATLLIMSGLSWFFGYLGGQPPLSVRWMAMKNDREVKRGMGVAILWTILAYSGAFLIGICALTLYGRGAVGDPEQIVPFLLLKLLPVWLTGILLVGAIAAMMSTASSQLLLITTSISVDIVHKALKKEVTDGKMVMISRMAMLAVGGIGLTLALTLGKPIFNVVSWAWAGIGCTFSPVVILSFYWKRFSGAGVVAALTSGFLITVIWLTTGLDVTFSAMAASFIASGSMAVLFSLLFPQRQEDPV